MLTRRTGRRQNGFHQCGTRWAPAAAAFIFAVDLLLQRDDLPVALTAALDESAHVATASLMLAATQWALPPDRSGFVTAALVGSVAFDLDHLPEVLGWNGPSDERPGTHSLATIAFLIALAPALPDRWQATPLGLASGAAAHLIRDLATGGAPLGAPVTRRIVRLPYAIYALALIAAAARIMGRQHSSSRPIQSSS